MHSILPKPSVFSETFQAMLERPNSGKCRNSSHQAVQIKEPQNFEL